MESSGLTGKIKENLLSVGIVILAVIIAFKVYQAKETEINSLKNRKAVEEQKNTVLQEISGLEKKLAYLDENINNKAISAVLDKIGDLAKTADVKISKINPLPPAAMGAYTKYPFDMSFTAADYHKIGKFVSLLENSPDIYMVEKLAIAANAPGEADSVTATLTVYTITLNK